ncbi:MULTISPECIES: 2-hydroxychromene-2-carboxylate isomerase [unclassified Inquilinus]|uniref:2-hydroxychromene-2-carboxylate isomerase n=1 Tax=unclassified Inquilinus TaxID=2645927 RepID=UPI003F92F221
MPSPIEFYFDFASPYGYLAATQIDALASRHGRTVAWKPVLLGPILKHTGGQPNRAIPLRGPYMEADAPRFAAYLGVPFTAPAQWPIAALAPSRAVWWLADREPGKAHDLAAALYDAHWGRGEDIAAPEAVTRIAAGLGLPEAETAAAIQTPEVKDRLRAETEAAMAKGVFGSPFFRLDGEGFWGADRLDHLAWRLKAGAS